MYLKKNLLRERLGDLYMWSVGALMQGSQRPTFSAVTDMIGFGCGCTDDLGWHLINVGWVSIHLLWPL